MPRRHHPHLWMRQQTCPPISPLPRPRRLIRRQPTRRRRRRLLPTCLLLTLAQPTRRPMHRNRRPPARPLPSRRLSARRHRPLPILRPPIRLHPLWMLPLLICHHQHQRRPCPATRHHNHLLRPHIRLRQRHRPIRRPRRARERPIHRSLNCPSMRRRIRQQRRSMLHYRLHRQRLAMLHRLWRHSHSRSGKPALWAQQCHQHRPLRCHPRLAMLRMLRRRWIRATICSRWS